MPVSAHRADMIKDQWQSAGRIFILVLILEVAYQMCRAALCLSGRGIDCRILPGDRSIRDPARTGHAPCQACSKIVWRKSSRFNGSGPIVGSTNNPSSSSSSTPHRGPGSPEYGLEPCPPSRSRPCRWCDRGDQFPSSMRACGSPAVFFRGFPA
jgi:hypothetical protein